MRCRHHRASRCSRRFVSSRDARWVILLTPLQLAQRLARPVQVRKRDLFGKYWQVRVRGSVVGSPSERHLSVSVLAANRITRIAQVNRNSTAQIYGFGPNNCVSF